MIHRRLRPIPALVLLTTLVACHPARQAPGMDVNDLSDGRGAKAGRFLSPADNAAGATDTDAATNGTAVENHP